MNRSYILGFLVMLTWSSLGHAFNKTASFVELHTGSMMGLAHVSYGWEFSERHNWSMGLGYVPELSCHDDMSIFSARYRYQRGSLYEFNLFNQHIRMRPGSFGLTFISGRDDDIYRELPDRYPDGYYYSTARRLILNYQWNFLIERNVELYFDLSALEVGVVNWVRNNEFYRDNYDFLGLDGIFTYGFGTRWRF